MHSLYNMTFRFLSVNVRIEFLCWLNLIAIWHVRKKTSFLRTEGISEHTHGLFYLDKRVACIAAGPCTRPNHCLGSDGKTPKNSLSFFVVQKKLLSIRGLLSHILCSCFVLFFMDGELPIAFLLNFKSMPKRISQDNTNGEQGKLYKQCQINQ